jgi:hypothetical protein
MATDVSSELSAGALIYLFADTLISSDKGLARGVSVPCSDVKVKLRELNDTMIAASLWSLRRGGALNLELSQKKKLMRTVTFVEVSYIKDIGAVGLEAQLLAAVERAGAESVTDVVMRWMGGRYDDPDQHVLTAVQQELVATGLGSEGRRSGLRKLGGGMAFEPD